MSNQSLTPTVLHQFKGLARHIAWCVALGLLVGIPLWITPTWAMAGLAQAEEGAPLARTFLPAVRATTDVPASATQSSADLIDAALARAEIDAETALLYKVYANFGDPRLPSAYRGVGDAFDTSLLRDVSGQYATLSSATRAILAPFFQPPIYQDSWYARSRSAVAKQVVEDAAEVIAAEECAFDPGPAPIEAGAWGCIDGGLGTNFRVWWELEIPGEKARAEKIAQAMQNDIWPKLVILMHNEPPSDKGPHRFVESDGSDAVWWDGGDGRLDIYLVIPPPNTGGAATLAYPPGCDLRPSFILIDPFIDEALLIPALSHEFFHTFQFGMDQKTQCDEWEWWSEATANWAIDFVYPQDNWEQQWAVRYLQGYGWRKSIRDGHDGGRSSYLLPLFLTKYLNDPGIIRRSWENAATSPSDSLAAIDQAVGGQLTELWHEFAKAMPNETPYDTLRAWDTLDTPIIGDYMNPSATLVEIVGHLPDGTRIEKNVIPLELSGGPDTRSDIPTAIAPLAMRVYRYRFQDPNARSVAFINPGYYSPLPPDAKILAFYKVVGQAWQQEDWTAKPFATFCRNLADQQLEQLMIIISNGQWRNRSETLKLAPDPLLAVTNIGCARWEGTFETENHISGAGLDITDHYQGHLVFAPRTDLPENVLNPIMQDFVVVEATVTWTQSGTMGECAVSGGATTYSSPASFSGNLETASFGVDRDMDYRIHTGVISLLAEGTVEVTCPGNNFTTSAIHDVIATFGQGSKPISADGLTLQGRHAESSATASTVTTWHLSARDKD